ncbi:hypothetical protein HDU79_008020 [Rhizoclosmatium sp. JEL0117]|nr:hypothetical protein HDU79_008020 [Rhizoclosmatium sp. JEL0117]
MAPTLRKRAQQAAATPYARPGTNQPVLAGTPSALGSSANSATATATPVRGTRRPRQNLYLNLNETREFGTANAVETESETADADGEASSTANNNTTTTATAAAIAVAESRAAAEAAASTPSTGLFASLFRAIATPFAPLFAAVSPQSQFAQKEKPAKPVFVVDEDEDEADTDSNAPQNKNNNDDEIKQELDLEKRRRSPRRLSLANQQQQKPAFNTLLNPPTTPGHPFAASSSTVSPVSPPVPLADFQSKKLDSLTFAAPSQSQKLSFGTTQQVSVTSEVSSSSTSDKGKALLTDTSSTSPSKYNDILSFLAKKGDQDLNLEEYQKLQQLIQRNIDAKEATKIPSVTPSTDPFRQSVALELSDLDPVPKQQQQFQFQPPSTSAPLFTFGSTASTASAPNASIFGPAKPLFAPVFTFKAKDTATSRITTTNNGNSISTSATLRAKRAFRAPGQYTGAAFSAANQQQRRRAVAAATTTTASKILPTSVVDPMDTAGDVGAKRHRYDDEEGPARTANAGKKRRGNTYGLIDDDDDAGVVTGGSDSASKLILESLEESVPPPTVTSSFGSSFAFGDGFDEPDVPPPTVIVHHIPKTPVASNSTIRDVKAAIASTAKPKSALVNARISELKGHANTTTPVKPSVSESTNSKTSVSGFPVISSVPELGATPSAPKPKVSSASIKVSLEKPVQVHTVVPPAFGINNVKIPSPEKPAFGFGVKSTPAQKEAEKAKEVDRPVKEAVAVPAKPAFSFGVTPSIPTTTPSTPAPIVAPKKSILKEKSPEPSPSLPKPASPTKTVSFGINTKEPSTTAGDVWEQVLSLPKSQLPKFKFGVYVATESDVSFYLNKSEFMDVSGDGKKYDWTTLDASGSVRAASPVKASVTVPAPAPVKAASSTAKWECGSCMVLNDADKSQCVCCETPKPGSEAVKPAAATSLFSAAPPAPVSSTSGFSFGGSPAATPSGSGGFSFGTSTEKSVTDKPAETASMPGGFNFGGASSVPSTGGFSFGGITPATTKGGFSFGNTAAAAAPKDWMCETCFVSNADEKMECTACGKAKPGTKKASTGDWVCDCLVHNAATASKCVACDAAKPGEGAAKGGFGGFGGFTGGYGGLGGGFTFGAK